MIRDRPIQGGFSFAKKVLKFQNFLLTIPRYRYILIMSADIRTHQHTRRKRMKRTDLITFDHGVSYRVYEDKDGKLYYRAHGTIYGTFPEYCQKGEPISRLKKN